MEGWIEPEEDSQALRTMNAASVHVDKAYSILVSHHLFLLLFCSLTPSLSPPLSLSPSTPTMTGATHVEFQLGSNDDGLARAGTGIVWQEKENVSGLAVWPSRFLTVYGVAVRLSRLFTCSRKVAWRCGSLFDKLIPKPKFEGGTLISLHYHTLYIVHCTLQLHIVHAIH